MTQEKNIGFANAPRETEFKIGMCVHSAGCDESCWLDIIAVNKNGDAVYLDYLDGVDKISQKAINNFVLHMDSIWIGRKYREKTTSEGHVVDIVYSSYDHIAFREIRNYFSACFTRDSFLQCYEPVPLSEPAEQSKTCGECNDFSTDACCRPICVDGRYRETNARADTCFKPKPSPESWKPEIGKECVWAHPIDGDSVVRVMGYDSKYLKWVCWTPNCRYIGISPELLKPLQPEQPVKVGDIVEVHVGSRDSLYGRVDAVDIGKKAFTIFCGTIPHMFAWDVLITKLVPAQEGERS